MKREGKFINILLAISVLFTITTILSSSIQLFQGIDYDANAHILLRFVICIIAVSFFAVFKSIKIKSIYLKALVQYLLSMSLIFVLIYVLGFFLKLSETAYRDVFLNYTIPYIFIAGIIVFKKEKTSKMINKSIE